MFAHAHERTYKLILRQKQGEASAPANCLQCKRVKARGGLKLLELRNRAGAHKLVGQDRFAQTANACMRMPVHTSALAHCSSCKHVKARDGCGL
eukprot:1155212-Pelagomonas_calceolata.AAC.8